MRACDKVLVKTIKKLKGDQKTGAEIVGRALEAPIRQIAVNAGKEGAIICEKVRSSDDVNFGYNALTNTYGDMVEMGILVPTKVERAALQNAASIAGLLLTTDCAIADIREEKSGGGGGADGGMGGMGGMM